MADRITLRFDEELESSLRAEASRRGLSSADYVRYLVVMGLRADELQSAADEIKSFVALALAQATNARRDLLDEKVIEAQLETRNLLRVLMQENKTALRQAGALTEMELTKISEAMREAIEGDDLGLESERGTPE